MYLNLQFTISEFSFTKYLPLRINESEGMSDSCAQNQTSGGGLRIESKIDNQRIEQSWTNTKIDTIYYLAN